MNNSLEMLQNWFKYHLNGNWEHNFGIKIETLDNPGWYIVVDLEETDLENFAFTENVELFDNDWYHIQTKKKQLVASGDPDKLVFLIEKIALLLFKNVSSNVL